MHIRDYVPRTEFVSANDVILEPTEFESSEREAPLAAGRDQLVPSAVTAN